VLFDCHEIVVLKAGTPDWTPLEGTWARNFSSPGVSNSISDYL
jgi:hypothetical protein